MQKRDDDEDDGEDADGEKANITGNKSTRRELTGRSEKRPCLKWINSLRRSFSHRRRAFLIASPALLAILYIYIYTEQFNFLYSATLSSISLLLYRSFFIQDLSKRIETRRDRSRISRDNRYPSMVFNVMSRIFVVTTRCDVL